MVRASAQQLLAVLALIPVRAVVAVLGERQRGTLFAIRTDELDGAVGCQRDKL